MIDQVLWAGSHLPVSQMSDAGINPIAATGCTSATVAAQLPPYWQQQLVSVCKQHQLKLWVNVEATSPEQAARLAHWWELESGAGEYVRGYLVDDEPQFTGNKQYASPSDIVARIRALRTATPKPLWLNLIGNTTARPYFDLGQQIDDHPDIYTVAVYPWMGADDPDNPKNLYLMDLGQARWQVQQMLSWYNQSPADLSPTKGKICGVIAQASSWEWQFRSDKDQAHIQAFGRMTEAKFKQMARLALGRRDPSQGDSWAPLNANLRDGRPVLAFLAWYGWIDPSPGRRGAGESPEIRQMLLRTTQMVADWNIPSPYAPGAEPPKPEPEPPKPDTELKVKVPRHITRVTLEIER